VDSDETERQKAAQMFTEEDIRMILGSHEHLSVAYLSSSADSLLAYRFDPGKKHRPPAIAGSGSVAGQ